MMATDVKTLGILPGGREREHATWQIGPCGVHRDSDLIARANWQAMLDAYRAVDPFQEDHEVHRFRHWAVGWVEEVAYRPGSDVARVADELRAALASYPILDDDAHSDLEAQELDANLAEILADLRRDLHREFAARNAADPSDEDMTADELTEWLDGIDDDDLWDAAHEFGEQREGWHYWTARDIARIANALLEHATSDDDEESEVRT